MKNNTYFLTIYTLNDCSNGLVEPCNNHSSKRTHMILFIVCSGSIQKKQMSHLSRHEAFTNGDRRLHLILVGVEGSMLAENFAILSCCLMIKFNISALNLFRFFVQHFVHLLP